MQEFYSAMYQANLLYGTDIQVDDFEEVGLIAWQKIGNKRVKTYRYCANINCDTNTVELPCNCDIIEAVTYNFEDWNYTDNIKPEGDLNSAYVEGYIESRKAFNQPLYMPGKLVKYERVGNTLYINSGYKGRINILYRGVILDDNGLPELTDKEVDAIAAYVAYTSKYKQYLQTNNREILQQSQLLMNEWTRLCDAARVSEYINQNEMNDILDAKTSWNRKVYNKTFKMFK